MTAPSPTPDSMKDSSTKQERDLSFQPADETRPKTLTPDQVRFYNEHGYLTGLPGFSGSPDRVREIRALFDRLLEATSRLRGKESAYAINGFHCCCEALYDLVTDPVFLDPVQDLIGPDIIAWGSHFFCKQPGDPRKVAWHQDASYWPFTPARTVTVWLAVDDVDAENSALEFLPGTHRVGHLPWREVEDPAVLNQEIEGIERFGDPVLNTLQAGAFSLHADMLAHGSAPNRSSRRRCGLTIRYCDPNRVRVLKPAWGQISVLCRGKASLENGWCFNGRPVGTDLSIKIKPIGAN